MNQNIKLARYEEIPNIPLLLDQVLVLSNQTLSQFGESCQLTSSMVNNYVKRKLVPAPVKKRYSRDQVCMFIWICLLKGSIDLDAIQSFFALAEKSGSLGESYDVFCASVEELLGSETAKPQGPLDEFVLAAAQLVASKAQLLQLIREQAPKPEPEPKKKLDPKKLEPKVKLPKRKASK